MGLFKSRKKKEILDLTERYKRQQEKAQSEGQEEDSQSSGESFSFLGNLAGSSSSETESSGDLEVSGVEDKRRKLAKRLMSITDKLEELSNQIYHLQQRVEVMERKSGVGVY